MSAPPRGLAARRLARPRATMPSSSDAMSADAAQRARRVVAEAVGPVVRVDHEVTRRARRAVERLDRRAGQPERRDQVVLRYRRERRRQGVEAPLRRAPVISAPGQGVSRLLHRRFCGGGVPWHVQHRGALLGPQETLAPGRALLGEPPMPTDTIIRAPSSGSCRNRIPLSGPQSAARSIPSMITSSTGSSGSGSDDNAPAERSAIQVDHRSSLGLRGRENAADHEVLKRANNTSSASRSTAVLEHALTGRKITSAALRSATVDAQRASSVVHRYGSAPITSAHREPSWNHRSSAARPLGVLFGGGRRQGLILVGSPERGQARVRPRVAALRATQAIERAQGRPLFADRRILIVSSSSPVPGPPRGTACTSFPRPTKARSCPASAVHVR